MDLFYSTLSIRDQLAKFKQDMIDKYKITDVEKYKVIRGKQKNFGNCCMFIMSNMPKKGFMKDRHDKFLSDTIKFFKIEKHVLTYAYFNPSLNVSRKDMKSSIPDVELLISIVNPKLIVLLGEGPGDLFVGRKPKIEDSHGKVIAHYNSVEILSTYEMAYYRTKTGYEDDRYKSHIYQEDWKYIHSKYKGAIDADV